VICSDSAVLGKLRQFRDKQLTKNEAGQKLIQLHNKHSSEVAGILRKKPALSVRSAAILRDMTPGILFLLEYKSGRDIIMTAGRIARINRLFEDMGEEGSKELAETLSLLSSQLGRYRGMRFSQIWRAMDRK
jgi:hypothetical protein